MSEVLVSVDDRERTVMTELWATVAEQASAVLGSTVTASDPEVTVGWEPPVGGYIATLGIEQPTRRDLYMAFDVASAIACSGLLVMMQEKVILEKIEASDLVEDDMDAMGECVNQFISPFNPVLKGHFTDDHHVIYDSGDTKAPDVEEMGPLLVVSGSVKVAELCEGTVQIVVPRRLFDPDASDDAVAPPPADASAPSDQPAAEPSGIDLSPEEMAALREATAEALGDGSVAVLVPLSRERAAWEEVLEAAGVTYAFADDVHETRRQCDEGARLVVIDADSCSAGGLPALALLGARGALGVPVVVAASRPTRKHLVCCMAAGAVSYLVKPMEGLELAGRLQEIQGVWAERERCAPSGGL